MSIICTWAYSVVARFSLRNVKCLVTVSFYFIYSQLIYLIYVLHWLFISCVKQIKYNLHYNSNEIQQYTFSEIDATTAYNDKVTDFTGVDIAQLKNDFRAAMNEIAKQMTEEEKEAFIEESNQVFLMNNLIVNSVGGQNKVLYNLMYKTSAVLLVVVGVVMVYKMHK